MASCKEVSEILDNIYNNNRNLFTKDFRADVYLSVSDVNNHNKECNFSLELTDKTRTDYEVLKNTYSGIIEERETTVITSNETK